MSKDEKCSVEEIADLVWFEGLDNAVRDYLSAEEIEDPALAALWKKAQEHFTEVDKMLAQIEDYLEPYMENEYTENEDDEPTYTG